MDLKEKQIIYVDNKPHIKCNINLLPINVLAKTGDICIRYNKKLAICNGIYSGRKMHLYIISNEEIKELP